MAFLVCRIEKLDVAVEAFKEIFVSADDATDEEPFPQRADGYYHQKRGDRQGGPRVESRFGHEKAHAENHQRREEDQSVDSKPHFSSEV